MRFTITFRRALGLVTVAAALAGGTAMAASTPQGLKADGLRWQAIANAYQQREQASHSTEQGLTADGLRLQGLAQRYEWLKTRPAASYYTAQALRADALRWQAMARAYAQPHAATISSRASFDWGAAGIGAASGFALALCLAVLIGLARRTRETKLAV
jgi:hypothetical protein